VIDSPADVARRLRRDAIARKLTTRHWAGWRLELTYGPYLEAYAADPERVAFARAKVEEMFGAQDPAELEASREAEQGLWHLSASWRGGHPVEDGKRLLAELVVAFEVPESKRDGFQAARTYVGGKVSPQVTHWTWKDKETG
jgi:hypothetical protein